MADSATSTALVIAGRYLASPAALRARPEGPIDALDTRSGRTAQVRIVFASDGWDDDDFTDAVTRWCALACSEICGVLDFGEHEGRRFLVRGAVAGHEHRAVAGHPPSGAGRRRPAGAVVRPSGRADRGGGFPCRRMRSWRLRGRAGPDSVPGAAATGLAGGQSDPGGAARRAAHAGGDPARRGWGRTGPTARGVDGPSRSSRVRVAGRLPGRARALR